MIKGQVVMLHRQTVCYIIGEGEPGYGERCMVQDFEPAACRWRVQLDSGRVLLVPERALRVSFCLLPSSPKKLQLFAKVAKVGAQGSCGRGLIVQEDVAEGAPLFSEPPLIVTGALVGANLGMKHADRWRAYATLRLNAEYEARADGPLAQALTAFDDLGIGEFMPSHVHESAAELAAHDLQAASTPPSAEERAAQTAGVYEALARFHTNSFRLHNGVHDDSAAFTCSGLYSFIARMIRRTTRTPSRPR